LVTGVVGWRLVLPDLIEDQPAREAGGRTDAGAETGIAGDCTDDGAAAGADRGAGQRPLLGRRHVCTTSQRRRSNRGRENKFFHRALRQAGASAGHGNLSTKYTNTPSIAGMSSRPGCWFAHAMKLVSSEPLGGRGEGRQNNFRAPLWASFASSTITAPSTKPWQKLTAAVICG
jgi:hypothetical protein